MLLRKKVMGDLSKSRFAIATGVVAAGAGSAWLRVTSVQLSDPWPVVFLMSLVVIAQATMPLAAARASEASILRAIGADDNVAARFAAIEGGILGGLAGAVACAICPSLAEGAIWFVMASATGLVSAFLRAWQLAKLSSP